MKNSSQTKSAPGLYQNYDVGGTQDWTVSAGPPFAATVSHDGDWSTDRLAIYFFKFDIPADATIVGVKFSIDKKATSADSAKDLLCEINIQGTLYGDNKAKTEDFYSNNYKTSVYGGEDDTWGVALTPDNINNIGFGIQIRTTVSKVSEETISLLNPSITIYYTGKVEDQIAKTYQKCFKRIKIKRRLAVPIGDSYYESSWLDITDDVLNVSNVVWNIDDIELNNFTQGGFSLTCKNDTFKFAGVNFSASYFSGYLTRHRTKVKIEAGYIDEDGGEYSYDVAAGVIVGDGIVAQSDGTIYLPCISPATIFEEQPADKINEGTLPGGDTDWYDNESISAVVQYLYDLQISNKYVFHPFLESSTISPKNDIVADLYDFTDQSCMDALTSMAEVSNSCFYVDGEFKFNFIAKDGGATSVFTFYGPGAKKSDINILKAYDYNEGISNVYNRVAWYNTDPVVEAVESWSMGDGSSTDKYGQRTYSVDNVLVTTGAIRQTICDNLLAAYKEPKQEITLETKFVPQLNLLDRITLNFYGDYSTFLPALWGLALFGSALWTGRRGGIKIVDTDLKIISIEHDVMTFKTIVKLREV